MRLYNCLNLACFVNSLVFSSRISDWTFHTKRDEWLCISQGSGMGSPVPTSDLRSQLIFRVIAISWVLPKPCNSDLAPVLLGKTKWVFFFTEGIPISLHSVAAGMLDEDFMAVQPLMQGVRRGWLLQSQMPLSVVPRCPKWLKLLMRASKA